RSARRRKSRSNHHPGEPGSVTSIGTEPTSLRSANPARHEHLGSLGTGGDSVVTCPPGEHRCHRQIDLPTGRWFSDRPQRPALVVPSVHRPAHSVTDVTGERLVIAEMVNLPGPDSRGKRPTRQPDLPPLIRPKSSDTWFPVTATMLRFPRRNGGFPQERVAIKTPHVPPTKHVIDSGGDLILGDL